MQGGLSAIKAAELLVSRRMLGAESRPLEPALVGERMSLGVDRVMSEGGLYDPAAAAVALVQAEGDLHEASFIVRAYRSTLPRVAYSTPTNTSEMRVLRRITPAFQSAPGGQLLGATRDYTQRLLDWRLAEGGASDDGSHPSNPQSETADRPTFTRIADILREEGLLPMPVESADEPDDITRTPIVFPASRSAKLQTLARAETGSLTAFGYASMRGYGTFAHGTVAELRVGMVPIRITHPYTGQPVTFGEARVTECEEFTISPHRSMSAENTEQFALGYGLVFGQNERKAIAMAMLDRQLAEGGSAMASQEEFILMHVDGVEATGFVEHLKLPHYVEFQSIVQGMRRRRDRDAAAEAGKEPSLV